ncbi:MAG TPA: peptide chain release factor 1, partial [Thermodesulfobacteriota bacterium]|nr:peptide chain release factor 1 [Thermodesulfobacteriota bacterium]
MLKDVFKQLDEVEARYEQLGARLSDPAVIARPDEFQRLAREHAELSRVIEAYRAYRRTEAELRDSRALLAERDEELRELAKAEIPALEARLAEQERALLLLLLPKDPNDERNTILEIRAGTGGEEAALFAADLYRMYQKYAERRGWRFELMSDSQTGTGGFKEVIVLVEGRGAYSRLKYESGVHRVQRVPETEAQGRIHTSTVTVAVLPEAEEVDVQINPNDLRIDVMRASGPGGQSVNTTDSAVRITHLPTGMVVVCKDEKSQLKNKAKALKILRARLLDRAQREQREALSAVRRGQIGSGERSEKIRTYNFPQSRVTDHRIGLTLHQLGEILAGDLDPLIDALIAHYQTEALKAGAAAGPVAAGAAGLPGELRRGGPG